MGRASKGLKGKARLIALRNHLDSLGEDVEVTSEIRHNDQPRGEWVIAPGVDTRRRVLYIHGGAWAAGSPRSHRAITDRFSQLANAAVFALDYRLMPEHRFMDGIRDCRQAYTWLLAHGPDGEETADFMVVAGDSAGGSHTLSLIAWVRDNGIRQPDAAVALSPSTDLTLTAPSNRDNIRTDPLLGPVFGGLSKIPLPVLWWGTLAAFRISPTNPVASPLRGNLNDLPPTLIHASTTEMLLDNSTRYAAKARAEGSPVELHTWQKMVHVWHIFTPLLPEAEEAFEDIRAFLERVEKGEISKAAKGQL
jgi:acetyl esterase/lipase